MKSDARGTSLTVVRRGSGLRWRRALSFCVGAVALAMGGCAMPMEEGESEDVGTSQQEVLVNGNWSAVFPLADTLGMAINVHGTVFTWSKLAGHPLGCSGVLLDPCKNGSFLYASAVDISKIRGVGVGAKDGKVYAWYNEGPSGSWSQGTATNLGALQPFLRPQGVDSMDRLIDADQTSGGTWHYWWRINGVIRVSTSKSPSSGGTLLAPTVNAFPVNTFDVAGIGVDVNASPNRVYTWWQSDTITHQRPLSRSTDNLDLLQQ